MNFDRHAAPGETRADLLDRRADAAQRDGHGEIHEARTHHAVGRRDRLAQPRPALLPLLRGRSESSTLSSRLASARSWARPSCTSAASRIRSRSISVRCTSCAAGRWRSRRSGGRRAAPARSRPPGRARAAHAWRRQPRRASRRRRPAAAPATTRRVDRTGWRQASCPARGTAAAGRSRPRAPRPLRRTTPRRVRGRCARGARRGDVAPQLAHAFDRRAGRGPRRRGRAPRASRRVRLPTARPACRGRPARARRDRPRRAPPAPRRESAMRRRRDLLLGYCTSTGLRYFRHGWPGQGPDRRRPPPDARGDGCIARRRRAHRDRRARPGRPRGDLNGRAPRSRRGGARHQHAGAARHRGLRGAEAAASARSRS